MEGSAAAPLHHHSYIWIHPTVNSQVHYVSGNGNTVGKRRGFVRSWAHSKRSTAQQQGRGESVPKSRQCPGCGALRTLNLSRRVDAWSERCGGVVVAVWCVRSGGGVAC